jgi:transcriptional regulator with XRE-family HTH domain
MNGRPKRGRPPGTTTFDPMLARAFGEAVVRLRSAAGLSQEALAGTASIERSHIGKLERGEHLPNLVALFKIAAAIGCNASDLIAEMKRQMSGEAASDSTA